MTPVASPHFLTLIVGALAASTLPVERTGAAETIDISAQATAVNERLAAYHASEPVKSERKLRFVYFVPSDRAPAADYRRRLTRVMEETAQFFQNEMIRVGLKPKLMPLDRADDGLLRFVLVQGREPSAAYNAKEWASAKKVQDECRPALHAAGIDPSRETIALFSAIMEWNEASRRFRQKAPYRGGGDARHGFCWQIDAPPLDPKHLSAKAPMVDDGEYGMISLGDWNSKFVGGVIHELGHALGLPHNMEHPAELKTLGNSLMGMGNRTYGREQRGEGLGSFLSTADAFRLASHPFFTGSMKGLGPDNEIDGRFSELSAVADGDALIVSGRVESTTATYAVIAYADGAGNDDYDAIATTAVPDSQGRFRARCTDLPKGKSTELRLAGLQVNGLTFDRRDLWFEVSREGVADVSDLRGAMVLGPIVAALRQGRAGVAKTLTAALPMEEPARVFASPMLTPPAGRAEHADSSAKEVSLCDLKPERASVGWRTPAYDYSPEDLLVRFGGKLQRRFIYAHAPSTYLWKLDGTWKRFQATCGLGNGYQGSVVFVVKADQQERWRSDLVKADAQRSCDIDLGDASTLELVVEDGGDGLHFDHAFWFTPTLKR